MTADDVIEAFTKAVQQLPSGRFLGILVLALIGTIILTSPLLFIVLTLSAAIDWVPSEGLPGQDSATSWVSWSSWLILIYLISPLALAIIGLLLERIVDAVEARHYPGQPKGRSRRFGEQIRYAIRFFFLMIGVSIGSVFVAWFTPIPGWIIFTLASGFLLSREYFETVALRRLRGPEAAALTAEHRLALWMAGSVVAVALNIPVLNLVAPLIGVAAFTHLFHRVQNISQTSY